MKAVANILDLSPEFSHQAIEQRLPEVITAFSPWGQPLPGRRNAERNSALLRLAMMVGEAFSAFMDSPEKALALGGCNVDINAWLVRYVDFIRGTAEALVPKVLFEKDHSDVQACAKVVLQHFNMGNNAAVLLDRTNLELLEASVTALLPHLGKGSKFQVDNLLSAIHVLRSGRIGALTSGGQNETNLGNVLRSLEGLVLEDRRGFKSQFDAFYESYKVLAATSPAALLSGELLDVLTTGFVEKVKAPGRLSEESREILRSLEDALTVAQLMHFEADIFDHVALKLLRHMEPALDKLGGTAFQRLLGVFMECYRGGGEQTRPAKVWSGVLVAILELDIDQLSLRLAWHFLAILVGSSSEWDASLVERSAVDENGNQAVVEGRPLAPPEDRRVLAQDIATRQKGRLFPSAWRVFTHHVDYGVSDVDRVEDVAGVLLWCCSDEGLLEKKLLPRIGLVVRTLWLEYEQLSKKCEAEEVILFNMTAADYGRPWPDKCRPLAALLKLAFEWARSKPALHKALLEEVSRSGGMELCRAVVRDARKKAVLSSEKPKDGDLQWVPEFQKFCGELWEAIALRFGLKACSNPVRAATHVAVLLIKGGAFSSQSEKGCSNLVSAS
jgi:hypothetical protein